MITLGVQQAVAYDCPVRVPLLVFAKAHGTTIKDVVDVAACRRGVRIHQAAERGGTVDVIAAGLPRTEWHHATHLATMFDEVHAQYPACDVVHEYRVHETIANGSVRLAGKVDTVVLDDGGAPVVIVERKSGEPKAWHHLQVRVYAALLRCQPRAELWYTLTGDVERVVLDNTIACTISDQAEAGLALTRGEATGLVRGTCARCPHVDCGVRRWQG